MFPHHSVQAVRNWLDSLAIPVYRRIAHMESTAGSDSDLNLELDVIVLALQILAEVRRDARRSLESGAFQKSSPPLHPQSSARPLSERE